MRYADLKRRNLSIGSVYVEAVNKTHVEERMKRSGMGLYLGGTEEEEACQ